MHNIAYQPLDQSPLVKEKKKSIVFYFFGFFLGEKSIVN
jgi:hypothetical protein